MADDGTITPEQTAAQQAAAALSGEPDPKPKADPPAANLTGEAERKQDLDKALAAAKAAQKEADKLRAQLETIEADKLSDLEKAQKRAETAEQKATEAEERAVTLERSGWVTQAASVARFENPSDAASFLNLTDLDSEEKVKEAVAELAVQKPYLLSQGGGPTRIGSVSQASSSDEGVPVGPDGKPDVRMGLGQDLRQALTGRRR